ncbi:MAG: DUF2179 domain-containing protein [Caldimicrobium sp.]
MIEYLINGFLIFLARLCDVSLGTLRIVLLARGLRLQASLVGFFEVLIWLLVITWVLKHLDHPFYYIAFAAGFATGNYVGGFIENKLALGNILVRVITRSEPEKLLKALRDAGFIVTSINAEGREGPIIILFSVIKRKKLSQFLSIVEEISPQAFFTIEDIREVGKCLKETKSKTHPIDKLRNFFWLKRK